MNLNKEFRTLVVPVIKGSPILIGILIVAFFVARRVVNYSVPIYQTDVSIKIDNRDYGVGNFFLFNEEGGPKQSLSSAFLTEVELFKSRTIKEHTFNKLDFDVSYFRVGKIITSEIYQDRPFSITYEVFDKSVYKKPFILEYIGNEVFAINKTEESEGDLIPFEESYEDEKIKFTIKKNNDFWLSKSVAIKKGEQFAFEIYTLDNLVKSVDATNLFIKPIDKEITIIKVYFKHEVPEKAARFCNTFVDTYIEEAKNLKNKQTSQTLDFIDTEINQVEKRLKSAESKLTLYKQSQNLVNMTQETDATLKELTALDLRLVDFELQEVELNGIAELLSEQNDISAFSPNFKTVNDKVFENAFMKLKSFELERSDLLQKYTPTSSEVQNIQTKITDLRSFLLESIQKKLGNITKQKNEVQANIDQVNERLRQYPGKQQKIAELERDVLLSSQNFTYLTEKRTELAIAQTASFVFHRVIDYAQVPQKPIAPNVPLIYALFIFVALLFGLLVVYIWYFFANEIESKEELKDYVHAPIISSISDIDDNHFQDIEPYLNLYTNINILQKGVATDEEEIKPWTILISSIMPNEGRTFVVAGLGRTMAYFDKKVLLIDLDNRKPKLHKKFDMENGVGVADFLRNKILAKDCISPTGIDNLDILTGGNLSEIPEELVFSPKIANLVKDMKKYYDIIIIDTPPTAVHIESVAMMHEADLNLYMIQAHKSKARFVKYISTFLEEYKIPNFYLVLNGIRQHSGFYARSYRIGLRRKVIRLLQGKVFR
ncbi:MAG: capsular exopolysaccharide synthesis family protein [Cognaticolwellia sp.]|jgi:capsular exopolysaccharide synthesis family protein